VCGLDEGNCFALKIKFMNQHFYRTLLLIPAVWLSVVSISVAQSVKPFYMDENHPLEERVKNALSLMTVEEKVALCHAQSKFSSKGVARLGIPEIWMSDGPHGVREEILWDSWNEAKWTNDSCTAFPALTCLAATWNPAMSAIYGKAVGEEARYRNKSVLLGPGVNIYRTPLNGRNFEYMGEDPYLASRLVVPYIQELQKNGVAASVKHFALNNQEIWRGHINVELSDRALREIYLPAFKAAVTEGKAWTVMGSYNQFRGEHCCHNDLLLNKILKGEWRFDGAVITDWGGAHHTMQAAMNGLDIEMGTGTDGMTRSITNAYDNYYLALPFLDEVKKGKVPMSVLDDKASRVVRLIFRTAMNSRRPWGSFASPEHAAVARKVAEEGIVLLKNSGNLLPVDAPKYHKIAVVGENATRRMSMGGGSSSLKPHLEVSPLAGLKAKFGDKITYAMGYASGPPAWGREIPSKLNADSLREEAVKLAQSSELVIFVGGLNKNHFQDCEGGDRQSYNLPFGQDQLLTEIQKVNKNVVVVLITGNAVAMPWIDQIPAVVQAWYLGSEAGNAIAAVLSGEVNPSGKLPFSFPVKLTDNGAHAFDKLCYPGDSIREVYKEDILVGYRWHDTKKIAPLFAFGHGLSYTTFEISAPQTDKKAYEKSETVKLTFTVRNTGKADGAEVAQVYVTQKNAPVLRPSKELKGFKKVFLKAGEQQQVTIPVKVEDMAYWDENSNNWKVDAGEFVLNLGRSSGNMEFALPVQVK
jgi:beta-glucosidase